MGAGAFLADAEGVVSADVLVDRAWGAETAGRDREALYGYVSRLRRVLSGVGVDIVRDQGGYRLMVQAGAVDVHRFRDLVDQARAVPDEEQAASLWEEALGLWRGQTYAGVDTPWFNAQRDFLNRERLSAQLDLADIRLCRGQHDRIPAELFTRAEAHPLDERMTGQLMLALPWAHENLDRFPDGQLYAPLSGFDPSTGPMPPDMVLRGFLDALGTEPENMPADPETQAGLFRSLVADRRMLIVLDNARNADHVRPLLPGSATCTVIVTSRSHLGGLTATHGCQYLALDTLRDEEARQILVRAVGHDRVSAEPGAVQGQSHAPQDRP
ncbi:BTAD domain-containing putative transcriptional regulator [Streptomyces sp. ML-6]|uniref:AfsR/SARP family transcriptional regulator n=1 Tax=Streptomyces sp. ML-6 TaxID=2982693 RepID=UPI0024C0420F|nr:BTAD domain-containing putative transcriptional regulator [Streptomyces sp. ML-6]MDK0522476.1 hypothetical protein [Streptomyces sp. ML-6]